MPTDSSICINQLAIYRIPHLPPLETTSKGILSILQILQLSHTSWDTVGT